MYPFEFPFGGAIHFKASSAGADAVVSTLNLSTCLHPNVEPSYNTEAVTISGSELMPYHVEIPLKVAIHLVHFYYMCRL